MNGCFLGKTITELRILFLVWDYEGIMMINRIEEYLSEREVDYAVMITGPWGCGKTYFWKHAIKKRAAEGMGNRKSMLPVYVSLFGVSDVGLPVKIFTALASSRVGNHVSWVIPEKLGRFFKGISSFAQPAVKTFANSILPVVNIDLACLDLLSLDSGKLVICFDDFERSNISEGAFFGVVSKLTEHMGIHTLILCNEAKIKAEEAEEEVYLQHKEKCVRETIAYTIDYENVLQSIIDDAGKSTSERAKGFLHEHIKSLAHIASEGNVGNLRILKRGIVRFLYRLFPAWEQLAKEKQSDQRLFDMLIFQMACCIETEKPNHDKESFRLMCADKVAWFSISKGKEKNMEYHEKFRNTYYALYPYPHAYLRQGWFESIYAYTKEGLFDEFVFSKEYEDIPEKDFCNPTQAISLICSNIYEAPTEDFNVAFSTVWTSLGKGEINSPEVFLKLLIAFESMVENEAIDVAKDDMYARFEKNIESIRKNIGTRLDLPWLSFEHSTKAQEYKKKFDEFAREKKLCEDKEYLREIIELIKTDKRFILNGYNDRFFNCSGYSQEHVPAFMDIIKNYDQPIISGVRGFVHLRYCSKERNPTVREQESEFITEFSEELKKYESQLPKSPKRALVRRILKELSPGE